MRTAVIPDTRLAEILTATGMSDLDAIAEEIVLLRHLQPLGARLIISRPVVSAYHASWVTAGGIEIPDMAIRALRGIWAPRVGAQGRPRVRP